MKVTIESTAHVVELNGIPARVWVGETESGIALHCYITRVAIADDELRTTEFEQELSQQATPSEEIRAIPLRLIL